MQDLEDEERDDPGQQLDLREDRHLTNLHAPAAACNGSAGLSS
jgi:hypothetical protein